MDRITTARALALALLALVLVPLAPANASAGTAVRSVTVISEPGDYVGAGESWAWFTGSGQVSVQRWTEGAIVVSVAGGETGGSFDLWFAPPTGERLEVGVYEGVERYPFQTAGRAGMSIAGEGRGCNSLTGRFEILSMDDDLDSVWILYEQHCEGAEEAVFGEIRIGQTTDTDLFVTPTRTHWPEQYPGTDGRVVPVTVANLGADAFDVADPVISEVVGEPAFSVAHENCASVPAGGQCTVYVAFTPPDPGVHEAVLSVDAGPGGKREVVLRGTGSAGVTSLEMHSDDGDSIGQGEDFAFDPTNATFTAYGTDADVHLVVEHGDDIWRLDFRPDANRLLLPGTTFEGAARYGFNSPSQPGMDVSGRGSGCNSLTGTFAVDHARYSSSRLRELSLTFEQHCEGAAAALRGRLEWRVGAYEGTPPPPPDTRSPGPVTELDARSQIDSAELVWRDPTTVDWVRTIVRGARGDTAPSSPTAGFHVYEGSEGRALVRDLDPGYDYSFSLFPVDYAGNRGPGQSITLRAARLHLVARNRVFPGERIPVRGRLVNRSLGYPLQDQALSLFRRPLSGGRWERCAAATTDEDGRFVLKETFRRGAQLRARFGGQWIHLGTESDVEVVRLQR